MNLKPIKFWPVDEACLDQELVRVIVSDRWRRMAYWIPKEVVVEFPGQVIGMDSAKRWRQDDGSWIVEVWQERGDDDGHTDWRLEGYAHLSENQVGKLADLNGVLQGYWGDIAEYIPNERRFEMGFSNYPRVPFNEFEQL